MLDWRDIHDLSHMEQYLIPCCMSEKCWSINIITWCITSAVCLMQHLGSWGSEALTSWANATATSNHFCGENQYSHKPPSRSSDVIYLIVCIAYDLSTPLQWYCEALVYPIRFSTTMITIWHWWWHPTDQQSRIWVPTTKSAFTFGLKCVTTAGNKSLYIPSASMRATQCFTHAY